MSLTCVTGYWSVKNKHDNKYLAWFKTTLNIKCPYVIFSDKEGIQFIKTFRKNLPTYYVEITIKDFYMAKYKNRIITHELHCPSVELNLIWNEKIFLLQKASELNPYKTEFFKWIDAGICTYRSKAPPNKEFPNKKLMQNLPKDKFIYSSSNLYDENKVSRTKYYHHISGTFILHKNIIDGFVEIYKEYIDNLMDKNNIWTEQVILTHIFKDHPELFYKLCDGYGSIVKYLYG